MICPRCGKQTPDNYNTCVNCGLQLVRGRQPQQGYQQPPRPMGPNSYPAPQNVNPNPVNSPYNQPPAVPGKGLSIAGMVCGIVSLVLLCTSWFSLIPAVVGVVLSAIGYSKAKAVGAQKGMATAGIVTSTVAIGIDLIASIIVTAVGFSVLDYLDSGYLIIGSLINFIK